MEKTLAYVLDPKRIEKRNKAFHKLSPIKKRIAIAEDILLQIKKEKYVATPGTYIYGEGMNWDASPKVLQEFLLKGPECQVCGIGAAFLSLARLGNKISLNLDFKETIAEVFGVDEMYLIENLFEGWTDGETEEAIAFVKKYPDPTKRLKAIFKNIAKHGDLKL